MKFKNKIKYLIKNNRTIQFLYRITFSIFFRFIGLFIKIDKHLILINSYGGISFGDSPKVLYDAIIKDEYFNNFKIVWAFEDINEFHIARGRKVRIDSWNYFICALKSKIWISSVNIERGLKFKKRQTIYLNTWHGTPIKYIGNKTKGRNDYNFSNVDIMCSDGEYSNKIMIEDLGVKRENIILSGRPREDWLLQFNEKDIKRIKNELKIPLDKKVILYAPTWRESNDKGRNYKMHPPISYDKWFNALSNKYVLLIRGHHITDEIIGIDLKKNDFIFDVSKHFDVNHLYAISDILISDYSSAFFDFGLLNKPMFCFAYDYDSYKKSRGLYIDLKKEFPNGIKETENELLNAILVENYYDNNIFELFIKKYVSRPINDTSTNICINTLKNKI